MAFTAVKDPTEGTRYERLYARFTKIGQKETGYLISKSVRKTDGSFFPDGSQRKDEYHFDLWTKGESTVVTISANNDLRAKLDLVKIGTLVEVEFAYERPCRDPSFSPAKIFAVREDRADVLTPREISDTIAGLISACSAKNEAVSKPVDPNKMPF